MNWVEPYLHHRYSQDFDCVDFARKVLKEVFNKDLDLPQHRTRLPDENTELLDEHKKDHVKVDNINDAENGDVILLKLRKQLHVGVIMLSESNWDTTVYVLHNSNWTGGASVQSLEEMTEILRYQIIGIYQIA